MVRISPRACRTTGGTRRSRRSTRRRPRWPRSGKRSARSTWTAMRPAIRRRSDERRAGGAPVSTAVADICVVACAQAWRGDEAILASPMGLVPSLAARLARLTFSPELLVTDGEAMLLDADETVEG